MRTLLFTLILPAAIVWAQETKPAAATPEPAKFPPLFVVVLNHASAEYVLGLTTGLIAAA